MRVRQIYLDSDMLSFPSEKCPLYVFDETGIGDLVSVDFGYENDKVTLKYPPYGRIYAAYEEK